MDYATRIEADSISESSARRVTSVVWTMPRIVLAEAQTHRMLHDGAGVSIYERPFNEGLSKNSASSRAIPVERMLAIVEENPYVPDFGINQKGMQASENLSGSELNAARDVWLHMASVCIQGVKTLHVLNVHKQDANRPLEPFSWVTQIVTGDDIAWGNFFTLRCHQDAHPAIRKLARMTFLNYRKSKPRPIDEGQWHLPFVPLEDAEKFRWVIKNKPVDPNDVPFEIRLSVARCAWVSYNAHDGPVTKEKVDRVFDRLLTSKPVHASPAEHQVTPPPRSFLAGIYSNIRGFLQFRKLLDMESATSYNPSEEEIQSWGLEAS